MFQLMKSIILKIKFDISVQIIILISLFSGQFKTMAILFIIIFIHELGHILMALLMKYKIKEIVVLPFGFIVKLDDIKNDFIYKELLIYLAGPFINLVIFFILTYLNMQDSIVYLCNTYILLLNLLPIYPLDGGKIVNLTLHYFSAYKIGNKLSYLSSMLVLSVVGVWFLLEFKINYFILSIFLLTIIIKENYYLNSSVLYFLFQKYKHPNNNLNDKVLQNYKNPVESFYKGVNNNVETKNKVINESNILKNYFKENH